MSGREPARWPDDVQRLLEHGRTNDVVPAARASRLWARIERSLAVGGGGGGSAPAEASLRLVGPAITGGGICALLFLAGVFAFQGGEPSDTRRAIDPEVGARSLEPSAMSDPVTDPPRTSIEAEPPVATETGPAAIAPADARTDSAPRVGDVPLGDAIERDHIEPVAARAEAPGDGVERESELIATADAALRRGDLVAARRAIAEHRQRFPRGVFIEERDALAVGVLVAAGQTDAARTSAERFVTRYPQSIFSERVERALE
jgi:hypothetical protein